MQVLTSVSAVVFSLNGKSYPKIYQPLALGSENLALVNIYDTRQKLFNNLKFDEVQVSGIVATSQADAMSKLVAVTYSNSASVVEGLQSIDEKGQANGYVPLNGSSQIDGQYLPSYVDDVLEFANAAAFPATGEAGKLYVDKASNLVSRWSGSTYIQVGGAGAGDVESVFGRTGIITAQAGDYSSFYLGLGAKAADANLLDGLNSTQFLRKDISDTMSGVLTVNASGGQILNLKGTLNGVSNSAFLAFLDGSNTRQGWIGYGADNNSDMYLFNQIAGNSLRLREGGGSNDLLYSYSGGNGSLWHDGKDALLINQPDATNNVIGNNKGLIIQNSLGATFGTKAEIIFRNGNVQNTAVISSAYSTFSSGQYGGELIFSTKRAGVDSQPVERARLTHNGFTVTGNVTAGAFYESSLRSLKTNIKPFEKSALDIVSSSKIYTFDKKDGTGKDKIGVMIDESPKELANEDGDKVDIYKALFVAYKAIQELRDEIKTLKNG